MSTWVDPSRGVYNARRASQLSGVPVTTLHYWARHGILIPSVACHARTRLWSWGDLVMARAIRWLRDDKPIASSTPMLQIREALRWLDERRTLDDLRRMARISPSGTLYLQHNGPAFRPASGQSAMETVLGLISLGDGPDLLQPRPLLRILPGKLSGEPHIAGTRIASATVFALSKSGLSVAEIQRLYPRVDPAALSEAIELETALAA